MNKKGFTLIELLAVLIVLGLIAVIVSPIITNALNDAKMSAYKSTIMSIVRKIKMNENSYVTDDDTTYNVLNGVITPNLEYEGELNGNGYITLDSNGLSIIKLYNGNICAYKNKFDEELTVEEMSEEACNLKITLDNTVLTKKTTITTNSIAVISEFKSNETAKSYQFGIYKGTPKETNYVWQEEDFTWYEVKNKNYYVFKNLDQLTGGNIYTYSSKVTTTEGNTYFGQATETINELPNVTATIDIRLVSGENKIHIEYEGSQSLYNFQYRTNNDTKFLNANSAIVEIPFDTSIKNITAKVTSKTNGSMIYSTSFYISDPTIPSITAKNSTNSYILESSVNLTSLFNIGEFGISGGATVCKIEDTTYQNVQDIPIGTYTLICTVTLGNGLKDSASTTFTIRPHTYDITLSQPSNGTIAISGNLEQARVGNTITLSNTPTSGYTFAAYSVNGIPIAGNTFIMPDEDVVISGGFYITSYALNSSYHTFIAPVNGKYQIELKGARSGNSGTSYGAYTKGTINLTKGEVLYIYVGGVGNGGCVTGTGGGYNGGANAGSSGCSRGGGGATDVRCFISNGKCVANTSYLTWSNETGLNSRIMVAAGGGAGENNVGGAGGALTGGPNNGGSYATQTSGSRFGYAVAPSGDASGAGGGYYGGIKATADGVAAGGGSSFISGHLGCVAILEQATPAATKTPRSAGGTACTNANATSNIECSYHYSGKIFTSTSMTAGNNNGNGSATITYIP